MDKSIRQEGQITARKAVETMKSSLEILNELQENLVISLGREELEHLTEMLDDLEVKVENQDNLNLEFYQLL